MRVGQYWQRPLWYATFCRNVQLLNSFWIHLRRGHVSCFSVIVIVIMISTNVCLLVLSKATGYDYDRKTRYKISPLNSIGNKTLPFCTFLAYVTRPHGMCTPHFGNRVHNGVIILLLRIPLRNGSSTYRGARNKAPGTLLFCYVYCMSHKFNIFRLSTYKSEGINPLWSLHESMA